jgi:predicted nucleotidyltransferase
MSTNRTAYVGASDALLERITATLKSDERFIAAWLAGSFARGEQSWCSDLDLHVVVAEEYSETLCAQPWPMGARTAGERLALFQQFGEPAVVYDAHANNLVGGTFTYVLYKESGVNVDWMLIPQAIVHLEHPSLMLFHKRELPAPPLEQLPSPEQCAEHASLRSRAAFHSLLSLPERGRPACQGFRENLIRPDLGQLRQKPLRVAIPIGKLAIREQCQSGARVATQVPRPSESHCLEKEQR